MDVHGLNEDDLTCLGKEVKGSYYGYDSKKRQLIFSSHTFPSHRITVDLDVAKITIAIFKKRAHIEEDEEISVVAKVFRLFSRDGTNACIRDLWVRFDLKEDGWVASFYKGSGNDAITRSNPLTEVPANVADLASEALRRLGILNAKKNKNS